jgi:hypothetical protein
MYQTASHRYGEVNLYISDHIQSILAGGFMHRAVTIIGLICLSVAISSAGTHDEKKKDILTPSGSIPLPNVEGRIDHMAADADAKQLFVTGLENHSLEVVDLDKGKRLQSIPGFKDPQGIVYLAQFKLLLVGSRGDGTCRTFDAKTLKEGSWVDFGRNADNVRFDARNGMVYVGYGGEPGLGAVSAVDLKNLLPQEKSGNAVPQRSRNDLLKTRAGQVEPKWEAELKSHPESFQLAPDGSRVFVNVPDDHGIAVMDVTDKGLKLSALWPVTAGEKNFAMAIDPKGTRVFTVCRKPALLVCYDTRTGKEISRIECVGDCDDIFYDGETDRLYIIGGEGFIDVFSVALETGKMERVEHVPTAPRARTGLFIPKLNLICVGAPKTAEHPEAAILMFHVAR